MATTSQCLATHMADSASLDTRQVTTDLPTGTLSLSVATGPSVFAVCDIAARANPKRGFLIVSKVLGRHIPARPAQMRAIMAELAGSLPGDLPAPVVFLGMAETATALGQGVFAAYQAARSASQAIYLQTARQTVAGATLFASFEEGHSHATTHLVQIDDAKLHAVAAAARSLVIIDDECSTGNTFIAAAAALAARMPHLKRFATCSITDWSGGSYLDAMSRPATRHAVLTGSMAWAANPRAATPQLSPRSNAAGKAPPCGMGSRSGLWRPEAAIRAAMTARPGERILVLGDGEHSYEALLIAEECERQGAICAVQSITRTPALLGHAMQTRSTFSDAYGSGAPVYLYNMVAHRPERIIIAAEIAANQHGDALRAQAELGVDIPVELVVCSYPAKAGPC